eukprot:CAMPEP_0179040316 /NCGR_PEP_ID=MMETSP0796-20121207/15585_1 /TAXON_ID=73915 /ORGANISM="Pyrodinium bahamense, Strain pbaha01" /LENGTH=263 /DNA_ID=CAMNT_0020736659 /DNA_START=18 /DNA_END=809 /DNA_ORIENTATION=+
MPGMLPAFALAAISVSLSGCGLMRRPAPVPVYPTPPPMTAMPTQSPMTPAPTLPPEPTTPPPAPSPASCLCIFDIDRTLTGKQGLIQTCPQNQIQAGVSDAAYGGGTLTLSQLTQGMASSACGKCYLGTISAGTASGPGSKERTVLHNKLAITPGKLPTTDWSAPHPVTSPLVQSCPDTTKQNSVPGIIAWYAKAGVTIASSDVYFFDDRADNVQAFQGHPYNARQISCASRDLNGLIGMCGATLSEIVLERGIRTCSGPVAV